MGQINVLFLSLNMVHYPVHHKWSPEIVPCAPPMRLPSRNFRRNRTKLFLPYFQLSHIYLRLFFLVVFQMKTEIDNYFLSFFFFCPSSSVIFSLEIYLFMNGKRTGRLLPQK